jgi:hypothetical protein
MVRRPISSRETYALDGMLEALLSEQEPMAQIVVQLIPHAFRRESNDTEVWHQLADLVCNLAARVNRDAIRQGITDVEQIIGSAWAL